MTENPTIIYTHTDEAPALATHAFLPVVQAFASAAGLSVEPRDISLAARVLVAFSDCLAESQQVEDALTELGCLAQRPEANIVKLPNISASTPQLKAAIAELQGQGFDLPDYPEEPAGDTERAIRRRYDTVKGSAVNPVLREGNSDRRVPRAVKQYARQNPHHMGAWSATCKTHVATMASGDFRGNECSQTVRVATVARIEHVGMDGSVTVLKSGVELAAGDVFDTTFMSKNALVSFLGEQVAEAREQGVLFSLHLKATMMKVSDPIIFGHAVRVFFKSVFDKHAATLEKLGVDGNHGIGELITKVQSLPEDQRAEIEGDLRAALDDGPGLAMVNSDRGITNLHVPSDVIIDASMPVMVRDSGKMWNAAGELQETKAVIPDRCYAGVYQAVIDSCREHGALDPRTMGSVPNVGLMAGKAEEYGSHDKTFEIAVAGTVRVVDTSGVTLTRHAVEAGDIWRMCQVRDDAIADWVKLAVTRARATGAPMVFWLDAERPHDVQLIAKVERHLRDHDTDGLEFHVMAPADAARFSLERIRGGQDAISVTGNVLRDYLTDLFPILEVGTSAKMLSIVPLMNGGGLFETGAGGSAPKHVQQFEKENHLRWDSLGEFLALAASLEHLADRYDNPRARILGNALEDATEQYLINGKSPSRVCGELGNRGSQVWLTLYWARALAAQADDAELAARFAPVAERLGAHVEQIVDELNSLQGRPMDIGGYYRVDPTRAAAAMQPCAQLAEIIAEI